VRTIFFCVVCVVLFAGCASNDASRIVVPAREQSMIVDDPRAYQEIFQQLQRAAFVRQGLTDTNEP